MMLISFFVFNLIPLYMIVTLTGNACTATLRGKLPEGGIVWARGSR